MKNNRFIIAFLMLVFLVFAGKTGVYAAPTDEVLNYDIVVDVNDDATLSMVYTIDWKVLDDSIGKVEWLTIGIPNRHYTNLYANSDNIRKVTYSSDGGHFVRVDFNDSYGEDEVIHFSFGITLDYMYSVNEKIDGYTLYSFTPGWFDGVETDRLTIRWNCDNVESIMPSANIIDGYYTWEEALGEGEKFEVQVSYPNSQYAFDETKSYNGGSSGSDGGGVFETILGIIFIPIALLLVFSPVIIPVVIILVVVKAFKKGSGFNSGTTTKVTRTLIEYYPVCQGCGAARTEGKKFCEFCGRSMVKNEETITEEKVPEDKKDILKFKTDGSYRYSSNPNTYVVVHTTHVHRPAPPPARSSSSGSTRSHSSCAHSSCAHSSCACACACACAGGGRAGCSNKDFYNTNLKLKYLLKRKK